jgi:hypothetical protein
MKTLSLLLIVLSACAATTADPTQACLDATAARAGAAHRLGCPSVRFDCPTGPVFVVDAIECVATMAGAETCADLDEAPRCDAFMRKSP